nr:proteasome assembly chaperone 3-like isoform X2 [Pocillopora verrucosa]
MAGQTVKTRQTAAIIEGTHTEVFCSAYQDRIFLIVSQFEKIGTLVSVNRMSPTESSSKREAQTFNTRILMGSDKVCSSSILLSSSAETPSISEVVKCIFSVGYELIAKKSGMFMLNRLEPL